MGGMSSGKGFVGGFSWLENEWNVGWCRMDIGNELAGGERRCGKLEALVDL